MMLLLRTTDKTTAENHQIKGMGMGREKSRVAELLRKSRVLIDWFMHAKIPRFYGHPSSASLLVHLPVLDILPEKEHKTDESVSARSPIRPCDRQRERERDLHKLVALAARQSEANFLALSVPALFRLLLVCAHGDEDTRVRGMRVSAVSADRKRESARVPCVAGGREEALTVVLRFGRALCALAVDRAAGRKDGGGAGEEGRGQLKARPCGFSRGTIRGTYSASVPSLSDEDEDWEVDCPLEA